MKSVMMLALMILTGVLPQARAEDAPNNGGQNMREELSETFLLLIKEKDEDLYNRFVALNKLDEKALVEIVKGDSPRHIRGAAIGLLIDQTTLMEIAQNDKDSWFRAKATKKITDQTVLEKIASNSQEDVTVRWEAMSKITNQVVLAGIAKSDKIWVMRREAVKMLKDPAPALLAKIAKDDENHDVCEAAVEMLDDQTLLVEIAKNDKDKMVRQAVIAKINDQAVFAEITKEDDDEGIRYMAVHRINDQTLLLEIAKNNKDEQVRVAAVRKLNDQAVFAEFAKNDTSDDVRRMAVAKLNDQTLIAEIAKSDRSDTMRFAATGRLQDQGLLAELAKNDNSHDVRGMAVSRLNDQAVLTEVAQKDKAPEVRQWAVRKLNDHAVLMEIAKNDGSGWVRLAATEKLNDQALLTEIAKNDKDAEIRKTAARRLTDQTLLAEITKQEEDERNLSISLNRFLGRKPFTLSHYSKCCAWVAVGTVLEEPEPWEKERPSMYSMVLSLDAYIYGEKLQEERFKFYIYVGGDNNADEMCETDRRVPKIGDRMLMFLRLEGKRVRLISEVRAHIFLDDKETEEEITSVVNKYIHTFKDGGKQDKDGYYEFLCSLFKSPVKRIRDDAELDLMLFFTNASSLDLEKPLADNRVRNEIKDYLRFRLRNEKPKGTLTPKPPDAKK